MARKKLQEDIFTERFDMDDGGINHIDMGPPVEVTPENTGELPELLRQQVKKPEEKKP